MAVKVQHGRTQGGRERWHKFESIADANVYCETVRKASGVILAIVDEFAPEKKFPSRDEAQKEIDAYRGKLQLRAQFVGALDAWIIEGHYKSNRYAQPYVLREDGEYVQHHYNRVATR